MRFVTKLTLREQNKWKGAKRKQQRIPAWIFFLLPSLCGVAVFMGIPFIDVVYRSFHTAVTNDFSGFENYRMIFCNKAFRLASYNTLRFSVICIPLLMGSAFFIALWLEESALMQTVKSILLLPMALPTATLTMVMQLLFDNQGMINGFLTKAGGTPIRFLETEASFYVLIGSYIWKNLGYTVLLWLTGMVNLASSQKEAAKVDGASKIQYVRFVMLPSLRPMGYTIFVISFLNSFKVFREAYLVAGAYPQENMYLLQHLFNNWYANLELDKMAAAAVCLTIVITIVVLLLQRIWDWEER